MSYDLLWGLFYMKDGGSRSMKGWGDQKVLSLDRNLPPHRRTSGMCFLGFWYY